MRLLYVDDEPDIREVAVFALGLQPDWEVRAAPSGQEALRIVEAGAWRPDVVLLDVMMPGLDGPETLASLRRSPGGRDLPVIFVTARVLARERERLLGLGAAGVIAKPFDPMTIAGEVRRILAAPSGPPEA